jgi:hypothetical protein
MRSLLKIWSKTYPPPQFTFPLPLTPSTCEDNMVGIDHVLKLIGNVNADPDSEGLNISSGPYLNYKILADLMNSGYINLTMKYCEDRAQQLREWKKKIQIHELSIIFNPPSMFIEIVDLHSFDPLSLKNCTSQVVDLT